MFLKYVTISFAFDLPLLFVFCLKIFFFVRVLDWFLVLFGCLVFFQVGTNKFVHGLDSSPHFQIFRCQKQRIEQIIISDQLILLNALTIQTIFTRFISCFRTHSNES